MKSRLTMGLAVALALFSGVPDQARAQCQLCVSCELGHENPTGALLGNTDAVHLCQSYSCVYMQEHGVHNFDCYTAFAAAAYSEVLNDDRLTRKDARLLLAKYPAHVVMHSTGRYIQVLDCQSVAVIGQVAISTSFTQRVQDVVWTWFTEPKQTIVAVLRNLAAPA